MTDQYLMALDFGTGAGRCSLVDVDGERMVSAYHEWSYDQPLDAQPGGCEFSPDRFWAILGRASQEAIDRAGIEPSQIVAVSSTSQREGIVLLDEQGKAIYAGPNRDLRAWREGAELSETYGHRIYQISGHWPNTMFAPARFAWLHEHRPEVYARMQRLLMINDWVLYQLSGNWGCEPTNAAETCLFNIGRLEWDQDLIRDLNLPMHLFPPVHRAGERIGEVTPEAAAVTGLETGTPVIVGGADTQCGVLGSGTVANGDTVAVAGTTTPVQMVLSEPLIDPQTRTWTGPYVLPEKWVLESNAGITGTVLRWFRDSFCDLEDAAAQTVGLNTYELMTQEAQQSPVGSSDIFAFMGPGIMNARSFLQTPYSLGGFLALTSTALWDEQHSKRHFIRAILESLAFAIRGNCEQIEEISQRNVDRLTVCGGSATSAFWVQMLANVTGVPILVPKVKEATGLGAAICAGVGAGVFSDFASGAEVLVNVAEEVEPIPQMSERYQAIYAKWVSLAEELAQLTDVTTEGTTE